MKRNQKKLILKSLKINLLDITILQEYLYFLMATYEGWVRVPISSSGSGTRPIKVQVEANSVADAVGMLRGQYGPENVVGFPTKVND